MVEFVDAIAESALNDWAVIKSYLGEGFMVLNSKYYLVTGPIMTINEASRTIVKLKDTEFNQTNDWKVIKSHPKGHRHHLRLKYNDAGMPIEPWGDDWASGWKDLSL